MKLIKFGTDGWVSRFDDGFDADSVSRIAEGVGLLWADKLPGARVYVGYDTRRQSDTLARVAAEVMAACGLDVRMSDRACPTAAVGWACANDGSDVAGGLIVTASESPGEYGGILLRGADGGPVGRIFTEKLEGLISLRPCEDRGEVTEVDITTPYLKDLIAQVDAPKIAAMGLKVVADPMHGASYGHLSRLLEGVGCEVNEIHPPTIDGLMSVHPVVEEPWIDKCESVVVTSGADLGIVVDGDGDRSGVIDEKGRFVNAHRLAALILGHLVENRGLEGRVIATLTASSLVRRQAERLDLEYVAVPVGFDRTYAELRRGGVLMACEEHGGICLPWHLRERDGLLICLLFLELLGCSGKTASELVDGLDETVGRMYYTRKDLRSDVAAVQKMRNVLPGLNPQEVLGKKPVGVSHADGLRLLFDDDAWVLVRPSRREPLVRINAEATTRERRDELVKAIIELVNSN